MNKHHPYAVGACAALLFAISSLAHAAPPPVVNPEQMDMGVEINAKIGKEKSKRNSMLDGQKIGGGSGGSGGGDNCGTVNINSNEKKSNSGIKDMFGKQSTTIVTGPVINMANCK
ncbi:hypothetical protein [Noviherbaspirillum aridicola]|uniref:Uncharacterized protein n=1 Tax=Noviherbaspirillum aridicola TaxID=2849687 RepID=A0ABQ4Q3R8_9BURK|nr:hypothetical protein [Noviherbaspirillum aridicola]GIZ51748.1 hypothetical protein NCCP691_17620 [Noviherbaspirillum aridicola]